MVGGRTLLAEDPRLTVRDPVLLEQRTAAGKSAQPLKVGVVSRLEAEGRGSLDPHGAFLHAGGGRVLVCTSARTGEAAIAALEAEGATVVVAGDERVDLTACMRTLTRLGIERLMVEGGSTLVAALLEDGLVDELQLAVAPLLFGGAGAPTPVGGDGWPRASAVGLQLIETSTSPDDDVILRYRVGPAPAS
jgi:riboflavin-specific deaminase-like protein